MCGIAGAFSWSDASAFDATRTAADLCAALAHRGPDGEGTFTDRGLLFVHRRLAIIDRTAGGRQPMTTPDGRYSIVYNGEIYNYRELRSDLERAGVRFTSASDTEVLLALVVRDGVAALSRARGMFALALWDGVARTLTVARDRFGIKPLYVAASAGRVAFASEIAALRRASLVDRDVSPAGVLAFLAWSYIPSPLTWLRGVESLAPGTWKRWHDGGREEGGTFADFTSVYEHQPAISGDELRARAQEAIRDSVAAHMVADVPVGIFLSGGIDSAAVVASARASITGELHTYTVAGDVPSMSEIEPARLVATRFETTHHELMVGVAAIERALPSIVRRLDAPSADAINSYFVSQAVAATRVKAVLSGVGGDEMFGGYPSFQRIPSAMRTAKWLAPVLPVTAMAASAVPDWRARKLQHFAGAPDPTPRIVRCAATSCPRNGPACSVPPSTATPDARRARRWRGSTRERFAWRRRRLRWRRSRAWRPPPTCRGSCCATSTPYRWRMVSRCACRLSTTSSRAASGRGSAITRIFSRASASCTKAFRGCRKTRPPVRSAASRSRSTRGCAAACARPRCVASSRPSRSAG